MIRSLKTLGLALVAVLALSAVAASAASAAPKLTPVPEEYPVTLRGTQTVVNVLELEGTRPTECATATFEGTIASKAEAETSEMTVTPSYAECSTTILGNKDKMTVTMNGCTYRYKLSETTTGTIASEGWEVTGNNIEVQCPVGAQIEFHVWTSAAKHEAGEPTICTYKIAPQTVGGDLDYKLEGKNAEGAGTSTKIKETIAGIATTKASGTITNCGAASQTMTLRGEVKVEGFNANGEMIRGKFED
jgi:hypothetical protein